MSADRPNILFMFTDQQSFRAMSCTGNPYVNTPYMDQIAAHGVRIDNCYCTSPVCSPARSSLVTGRMPHETGVNYNDTAIDKSIPTMGDIFRQADYNTVWTGKWHLPASYPQWRRDPFIPGFETVQLPAGMPLGLGAHTDAIIADSAIGFLNWEAQKQDKPWLLAVSLHNPHDICWWTNMPPVPHAHVDDYPPLPDNFAICPEEPEFMQICRAREHYGPEMKHTRNWDDSQWRAYLHTYYHMTEQVDLEIGRIMLALRENGYTDNTIVVFTSDHGEGSAAHHWVVKLSLYEEVVRVPMIVSWPGVRDAGRVDPTSLTSGADLVPTLCELAGVDCPEVTGRSFAPQLRSSNAAGAEFVVSELAPDSKNTELVGRMVRTQRYKYIAFSCGANPEMLFDLEADQGEMHNLAKSTDSQPVIEDHRRMLRDWMARTNDEFACPAWTGGAGSNR
jgi:arylsulfatase A-like enzyme